MNASKFDDFERKKELILRLKSFIDQDDQSTFRWKTTQYMTQCESIENKERSIRYNVSLKETHTTTKEEEEVKIIGQEVINLTEDD